MSDKNDNNKKEKVRENEGKCECESWFVFDEIILILQFGWFCREREREGELFLLRLSPIQDWFSAQWEREKEKYIISFFILFFWKVYFVNY